MATAVVRAESLEIAVQLACRAPSFHNSQPWRWVFDRGRLHLFIDPDRMVDTDQAGHETLISCGAVLDHLRVASAAAGWEAAVARFPDPDDSMHLASIDFRALSTVSDAERRRAEAIGHRRTDRLPFAPPAGWAPIEPVLRSAISDDAVFLDVLADQDRAQLVEASQMSEALRLYDSSYHAELSWWTAPFGTHDGIPSTALISAAESDRVDVGRNFPVTDRPERRADMAEDRSTIVVLSIRETSAKNVLRCGEALSAVLLECTLAGLATCTLTHIVEVEASKDILSALIAQPNPQVLIRVGTAPAAEDAPPTPRRPVGEVLRYRI